MRSNAEPETREAFLTLDNDGARWTKHKFERSELGTVKMPSGPRAVTFFIFKCTETGAERVWGYR